MTGTNLIIVKDEPEVARAAAPAPEVTLPDGAAVTGILAMTIFPVEVGGRVSAVVRIALPDAKEVDVHPILSIRTLEEWAALQGMRLVPIDA